MKLLHHCMVAHHPCTALTKAAKKALGKRLGFLKPLIKPVQKELLMELKDYLKDLPIPDFLIEWIRSRDPVSQLVPL